MTDVDLISKLNDNDRIILEHGMNSISPDDGKYAKASRKLSSYLTPAAEWMACALVQRTLLETRVEYGQAKKENLDEVDLALTKISPLNISLIEDKITKHDQLAVLEEFGRFVSNETKALLHPGTTSYDILDTARSYLFKNAWYDVIRPQIVTSIDMLCSLSDKSGEILQVGRTHLQNTSPVPLSLTFSGYAARIAERVERCDSAFDNLKGKIAGIVGTGASVDAVIGEGKGFQFEIDVLKKLGLKPDYTATQVVQKEALSDLGHSLTTLVHVLADFSNDIRMLYSSAINEVTSRDNAARLGGSSADATKNNPIQYENMCGKAAVVESGMRVLYEMIHSDFQRDLRSSVQARYQPQPMMTQTYEMFSRLNDALNNLSINEDEISKNLEPVRKNPSEAMVAILRGTGWVHPEYGVGHDFVKKIGLISKKEKRDLLEVALEDNYFKKLYNNLSDKHQKILFGKIDLYTGSSTERTKVNIAYAKSVADKYK